jgi:uncharacterized protein
MNVIGFDDAPFVHAHRGDVPLVGVVCAGTRVDGVLVGRVRRDGANAARNMIAMIRGSQFRSQVRLVMLQGIAVAGFNVVDVQLVHRELGVPVLVVTRHLPKMQEVRRALLRRVRGGAAKWRLVEAAGLPEPLSGVVVQCIGLDREAARRALRATLLHGKIPEPLRVAHLIAGAIGTGKSRGRA